MSRKGIHVEMAHHPQAILDAMAGTEGAVARTQVLQRLLQYLGIALLVIGLGGFVLMIVSSVDEPALILVFFVMFGTGIILSGISGRWRIPMLREHFDAARRILHTLRDDTGRKGHVIGWLDLSGPQQKEKAVRKARSGGGKQKVYYRDPWFKVKFKLVDGNLLRLTLEDKVKTKAGAIVRHQTQFSAKLVVNPDLYRLGEVAASDPRYYHTAGLGRHTGIGVSVEDGSLVLKGSGPAKDFSTRRVLVKLKEMYNQLEPIRLGPASPGVDAPGPGV